MPLLRKVASDAAAAAARAATDAAKASEPILHRVASDAAAAVEQVKAEKPLERGIHLIEDLAVDLKEQEEATKVALNAGFLRFDLHQSASIPAVSSSATMAGRRKGQRKTNQDLAHVCVLPLSAVELYMVFDGHGLHGYGAPMMLARDTERARERERGRKRGRREGERARGSEKERN